MENDRIEVAPSSDQVLDFWNERLSRGRRIYRLCCFILVACLFFALAFFKFREEGFTGPSAWWGALGLGSLALGIIQFLKVKDEIKYRMEITSVSMSFRFGQALPWLIAGFGTLGLGFAFAIAEEQWALLLLISPALIPAAVGLYLLWKPQRQVLTAGAKLAKEAQGQIPTALNSPDIGLTKSSSSGTENQLVADSWPMDERWWVRYPLACLAAWAGYFCAFEWNGNLHWIAAALMWFMAAGLARELLLWAIGFGVVALVVWGVSAGIAALPISLAIVLGAMIIAFAITNRK